MLSSDETKAGGKPRKAKPQDGEARQRKRKAPVPDMGQAQVASEASAQIGEPVALAETAAVTETAGSAVTAEIALPSPVDTPPVVPAVAEQSAPVSYRTVADAWGNYSRTSMEQTRSYFEKLAGARSLGAAFEAQAEFARQACETFVAQSQKIGELQGELTKQRLQRLEGFMEKMTGARRG